MAEWRTAETPIASTVHEPVGKPGGPGLWHHGWQLPAYIQHVANRLRAQGHSESNAVQMSVGIVKNWAEGHDGRGNRVSADVQAAAVKAVAEWEALKGAAHASSSGRSAPVTDAEFRVGPHGYRHGWIFEGAAGMAPEDKADHASKKIAGHSFPGGDDSAEALAAHREAAKAHREAARLSSSPSVVAHHTERARLHSAVAGGRMYARDAHKKMGLRSMTPLGVEYRAPLTSASINDLPDSAFAFIEPGGTKDASGKTTPRSLRHFPVHDAAHVRNALARAPQSPFGDKAMPKIKAAAAKLGVTVGGDSDGDEGGSRAMPDRAERRVTPSVMEIRTAPDGAPHIGGYAAVFGKLSRNLGGFVENVADTAFNQSRQLGWPGVRCRLNHDKNQLLGTTEGRTLACRTDNIGLDYEVEPPPSMRHVVEWVQRGDISTSSFAFNCPSGGDEWRTSDQGYPLRILHEVQLLDVAPVTEGEAYPDATLGLRSLAAAMDAPFEEVRSLAEADELRRFFTRTDRPSMPKPPPITGPAAMMALMNKRRDPWADQDV